jgi:hypothetical protein
MRTSPQLENTAHGARARASDLDRARSRASELTRALPPASARWPGLLRNRRKGRNHD